MWNSGTSRSPPPLQHPIPTHPHYIPEPPDTPVSSLAGGGSGSEPQGYMRFSSESTRPPIDSFTSGANNNFQQQHQSQPQLPPQQQHLGNSQGAGAGGGGYRIPNPAYGMYPQPPNVYNQQPGHGASPLVGAGGGVGAVPGFGGTPWGVNDATAQIGMQLGRTAVQAGQEYVEKNFGSFWMPMRIVKGSFNVSNGYVVKKLGLIVFPWRHRGWNRRVLGGEGEGNGEFCPATWMNELLIDWPCFIAPRYAPPREDVNSPDLYIPCMALVTYILLSALRAGLDAKFHPEVLAKKTSTAITIIVLECLFVKLGCYALGVQGNSQLVDILAYTGYKFVPTTGLLLLRILHCKASLYWGIFLYLFAANGFFLVSLWSFFLVTVLMLFLFLSCARYGHWCWRRQRTLRQRLVRVVMTFR
jgi:protein transport protein YIF1